MEQLHNRKIHCIFCGSHVVYAYRTIQTVLVVKTLLQQDISESISYDDLVHKFKRIVGKPNLSDQFKNIIKSYTKVDITWI